MARILRLAVGGYDPAGLTNFLYDPDEDRFEELPHEPQLPMASYGAALADGRWCFVEERKAGGLRLARPTDEGWVVEAIATTGGAEPCFVDIDRGERAVAVANYASGEVSLLSLEDSLAFSPSQILAQSGQGPDRERQEGPHAHCARFWRSWLYRTDLGTDRVLVHDYDAERRRLSPARLAFGAPPGEGPRHLLFHPVQPVAWLLTEMGSRLFTLAVGADGALTEIDSVSTLPTGFCGESLGGHLAIDGAGARLYATNRGHDSICVFDLQADGRPRPAGTFLCHGASPRHVLLLEAQHRIVVACEESDEIVVLELAASGDVGEAVARAAVPKPAFIALIG